MFYLNNAQCHSQMMIVMTWHDWHFGTAFQLNKNPGINFWQSVYFLIKVRRTLPIIANIHWITKQKSGLEFCNAESRNKIESIREEIIFQNYPQGLNNFFALKQSFYRLRCEAKSEWRPHLSYASDVIQSLSGSEMLPPPIYCPLRIVDWLP